MMSSIMTPHLSSVVAQQQPRMRTLFRATFFKSSQGNPTGGCSWGNRPFSPMVHGIGGMKLKLCARSVKLECRSANEDTVMKTKDGDLDVETPKSPNRIEDMRDTIHPLIKKLESSKFSGSIKDLSLTMLQNISKVDFSLIQTSVESLVAVLTKIKRFANGSYDDLVDLAAQDPAIQEIVKSFVEHNSDPDIGVLLHGPQGMGMTSLIHTMAGEAGVPLLSVSASDLATYDFLVQLLFFEARIRAPCIILIDDIEAIGGGRAKYKLITQMKKLKKDACVVVIATTNKLDKLDLALMGHNAFFLKVQVASV